MKGADLRRKEIQKMVKDGQSYREIGEHFHISSTRVGQLFARAKALDEQSTLGMDLRMFKLIKRALKLGSPTLMDIQSFIRQNPDWREQLLRVSWFGPKRLNELEAFCKEQGILNETPAPQAKDGKKKDIIR